MTVLHPLPAYPIVDADSHVIETDRTWDYLEPYEQKFRPQLFVSSTDPTRQYWVIDGKIGGFRFPTLTERELSEMSRRSGRSITTSSAARELDDVGLRLEEMDRLGIDLQILHNTLWIEQLTDQTDVEVALCRSWNRWMIDLIGQGDQRLFWSCVLPMFDPDAAIDEMRFARQNGAVAVCVRPFERDLLITDPYFHPLFDEAQSLGLTIVIHIGNGNPRLVNLLRGGRTFSGGWASFRIPTVMAAHSLIETGIGRTFPDLHWGIVEASASWVPWVCQELARSPHRADFDDPFCANNIWISAQADDDLPYLSQFVGTDRLVVGSDFGHSDASAELGALAKIQASPALDDEFKQQLLYLNAMELFRLESPNAAKYVKPAGSAHPVFAPSQQPVRVTRGHGQSG